MSDVVLTKAPESRQEQMTRFTCEEDEACPRSRHRDAETSGCGHASVHSDVYTHDCATDECFQVLHPKGAYR